MISLDKHVSAQRKGAPKDRIKFFGCVKNESAIFGSQAIPGNQRKMALYLDKDSPVLQVMDYEEFMNKFEFV